MCRAFWILEKWSALSHRVYFLLGVQGQTVDKLASEVTSKQDECHKENKMKQWATDCREATISQGGLRRPKEEVTPRKDLNVWTSE